MKKAIKDLRELSLDGIKELYTQGKIEQVSPPLQVLVHQIRINEKAKFETLMNSFEEGLEALINLKSYYPEYGDFRGIVKDGTLDTNAYMRGPTTVCAAEFDNELAQQNIVFPVVFYKIKED